MRLKMDEMKRRAQIMAKTRIDAAIFHIQEIRRLLDKDMKETAESIRASGNTKPDDGDGAAGPSSTMKWRKFQETTSIAEGLQPLRSAAVALENSQKGLEAARMSIMQ